MRDNGRNVEDQYDGSVSENRSAAHKRRGDQIVFQRLDDKLFLAHQAIDSKAEPAPAGANHDYEKSFGSLFVAPRDEAVQAHERQNLLAQLEDFVAVHAMNIFAGDPGDFSDRR